MNRPLITEMQDLLMPARQRLQRLRWWIALRVGLARCAWLVPLVMIGGGGLAWLLPPFAMFSQGQLWMIVAAVILAAIGCLGHSLWTCWQRGTAWLESTQILDEQSNPHNLITTAYDLSLQGHESIFARLTIEQGVTLLKDHRGDAFDLPATRTMTCWARWGLVIMLPLVWVLYSVPRIQDGGADMLAGVVTAEPNTLLAVATEAKSAASTPSDTTVLETSLKRPGKTSPPTQTSLPTSLSKSDAVAGSSSSESGPALQQAATQASAARAAKAAQSQGGDTKTSARAKSHAARKTAETEDEKASMPARMHQRAGSGGAPDSESALQASLLTGERERADEDESGDDQRKEKEKQPALAGTAGQPLLSDRQGAPSRELGMSGKKSNKPGDGRGGPGTQKKSRATATVLSGMPVPVHVKGMKQPGKSKSQARTMPLSASQPTRRPVVQDVTPGQEGAVLRYYPEGTWRVLIDRYTELLRQTEMPEWHENVRVADENKHSTKDIPTRTNDD